MSDFEKIQIGRRSICRMCASSKTEISAEIPVILIKGKMAARQCAAEPPTDLHAIVPPTPQGRILSATVNLMDGLRPRHLVRDCALLRQAQTRPSCATVVT